MKILWGNQYLCDGASRDTGDASGPLAGSLSVNGQRVLQIVDLVRAASARIRDRGNRKTTVAFAVQRQYSSVGAAEFALLKHAAGLPDGTADLAFTADSYGKVTLYDAALENVAATYSGCRATYTYTFRGGQMGVNE